MRKTVPDHRRTRIAAGAMAAMCLVACACAASSLRDAAVQMTAPAATDLVVDSGGVPLAATIVTPAATPALGVVMLPGSGPAPRERLRSAAERLAADGMAVLIFDKRGSGESGGDWRRSSLDDLARDAIAASDALAKRYGVQVGFLAHSQGNWVATRAAELGASPAFLVAVSGGGVSPRQVEAYAYEHRVASASADERRAAAQLVSTYFDYLAGTATREALDQQLAEAQEQPWYEALGIGRVLVSGKSRGYWQWVAQYDPAARAAQRRFPCLVVLGGADHVIPVDATVAAWQRQIGGAAAANSRIVLLPGRDHHLNLTAEHGAHGLTADDSVWRAIATWLLEIAH